MPTEILTKNTSSAQPQIAFADHSGDFAGQTAKNKIYADTPAPTDIQLDLTSLATLAGRESAKVNLGSVRAARYSVMATLEFAVAPVTGALVEFHWAPSPNSSAPNGNPMDIDGVDGVAPSGFSTLDELIAVCQFIGVFTVSADATTQVQTGHIGIFSPAFQHGMLIVVNKTLQSMGADAIEMVVVMEALIDEAQ